MTELDDMRSTLIRLLEGQARIEENLRQQDVRTALFWQKDWPTMVGRIDLLNDRIYELEQQRESAAVIARGGRWLIATIIAIAGITIGSIRNW